MFKFSMLQLTFERYLWLCIARGKAIAEVHNKRRTWRRIYSKRTEHKCKLHVAEVVLIKSLHTSLQKEGEAVLLYL